MTLAERFWPKVDTSGDCWLWRASVDRHGYGRISMGGRGAGYTRAHRASWMIHHGPIPKGLMVLHSCDTPGCVNPAHLFLGTQRDNMDDALRKGRLQLELDAGTVRLMRERYARGDRPGTIARELGVHRKTVVHIVAGTGRRYG